MSPRMFHAFKLIMREVDRAFLNRKREESEKDQRERERNRTAGRGRGRGGL
jgi:hypothetical protein